MEHQFIKQPNDKCHDRYRITLTGGTDEAAFGRVFDPHSTTHRPAIRELVVQDGEVKRKAYEVWMEPLTLVEVGAKSNNFESLSDFEAKALAELHGLKIDGVVTREHPERELVLAALRAYKPAKVDKPAEPPVMVIPQRIKDMDEANLEVEAAKVGISIKGPGGKTLDLANPKERAVVETRIVRKLASV